MTKTIITEAEVGKTLWETIRDAIQGATSGDYIVLPENNRIEFSNTPILTSAVNDLTVDFNGTEFVNVGTGDRPESFIRFTSCNNLRLLRPTLNCGGLTPTGSEIGYGLDVRTCDLAEVVEPRVQNTAGGFAYCVFFTGVSHVKMRGGLIKNGGYGLVRFQSCQVTDILDTDLRYDDDRDLTAMEGRWANWETTAGSLNARLWKWKGGLWSVKSGMTNTCVYNFNPVNNSGRVDHCELDGVTIDNQNFVVDGNMFSGKSEDAYTYVVRNCWFNVPGNTTAVRGRLIKNGGSMLVENCRFESGNLEFGCYSGEAVGSVTVRNSVFANSYNLNGSVFNSTTSGQLVVDIDKDTRFFNVGGTDSVARFFNNRQVANPVALGVANKYDCQVHLGSGTGQVVIFRFGDKLGSHRIGPNFKVFNPAGRLCHLAYGADNGRLCITGFDGIGRFDHRKDIWLSGATGTMGVASSWQTSADTHAINGSAITGVPAQLGDRIINHNKQANGKPDEWIHNGTSWTIRNKAFQVL